MEHRPTVQEQKLSGQCVFLWDDDSQRTHAFPPLADPATQVFLFPIKPMHCDDVKFILNFTGERRAKAVTVRTTV